MAAWDEVAKKLHDEAQERSDSRFHVIAWMLERIEEEYRRRIAWPTPPSAAEATASLQEVSERMPPTWATRSAVFGAAEAPASSPPVPNGGPNWLERQAIQDRLRKLEWMERLVREDRQDRQDLREVVERLDRLEAGLTRLYPDWKEWPLMPPTTEVAPPGETPSTTTEGG